MTYMKKFVLPGFLLLVSAPGHAENTVLLAGSPDQNQWFITVAPALNDDGPHAARLHVDFAKARSFLHFHRVKSASLSIRLSCSQETIDIDSIHLLGESGHEIGKVAAAESSPGTAHHLPNGVVKSAFSHVCTKPDSRS